MITSSRIVSLKACSIQPNYRVEADVSATGVEPGALSKYTSDNLQSRRVTAPVSFAIRRSAELLCVMLRARLFQAQVFRFGDKRVEIWIFFLDELPKLFH
jgi:hypothetical protein